MTINTVHNGDIQLRYETIGPPSGEPLLLLPGIGAGIDSWPDGFCEELINRGFRVARMDNRDSGLSTHLSAAGRPNQLAMLLRPGSAAAYRLEDMAADAVCVLDALRWSAAHVLGMSLGGMIAQVLAVDHPDRVRTLTSIASAPAPRIGQPKPMTLLSVIRVANPKRVTSREKMAQYAVDLHQITASPAYPVQEDELREIGRRAWDNGGMHAASVQRQTAAAAASGDRRERLGQLQIPALVLHGEADRMIRPNAGKATADAIPGSRLIIYPGMGHELPRQLWGIMIDEIVALTESGSRHLPVTDSVNEQN